MTIAMKMMTTAPLPSLYLFISPSFRSTHLLPLAVGQVALRQHEAAGADVHLTPRANQTHVLLHDDDDNNTEVSESAPAGGRRPPPEKRNESWWKNPPAAACTDSWSSDTLGTGSRGYWANWEDGG